MKWQCRIGKAASHQLDFRQRGGVEMADAGGIHLIQHLRRRIGLDRIKRIAGKAVGETTPRRAEFLRKEQYTGSAGFSVAIRLSMVAKRGSASSVTRKFTEVSPRMTRAGGVGAANSQGQVRVAS